jgi:hypothetical protein
MTDSTLEEHSILNQDPNPNQKSAQWIAPLIPGPSNRSKPLQGSGPSG